MGDVHMQTLGKLKLALKFVLVVTCLLILGIVEFVKGLWRRG